MAFFGANVCVCSIESARGLARAQIPDLISSPLSCARSHRHAMHLIRTCAAFAHPPLANSSRPAAEARSGTIALVDARMAMLPLSVDASSLCHVQKQVGEGCCMVAAAVNCQFPPAPSAIWPKQSRSTMPTEPYKSHLNCRVAHVAQC